MLKHYKASFWAQNLTTYRVLSRIHPGSKILSLSDCTRVVTLLPRSSIHLNKSLTRLKSNLCWNTIASFWAGNLTRYRVLFFVYTLDQKFLPSQTVLRQWHSSLEPQFIWIGPWLVWKAFYIETLYSDFVSAKFDTVSSTFFACTLDQKHFPSQTVLGQWHSSLEPQFIWISPGLGWKATYVETLYSEFLSANLTTYRVLFSYTPWIKNSFPIRLYSGCDTPA